MLSAPRLMFVISISVAGLLGAYSFGLPLSLGFVLGLVTLIWFCTRIGIARNTLIEAVKEGILHTREVIWILLLVGILIPAWTASGTIPFMIDTGLDLLDPAYFVTFAFVFSSMVSMTLGTSTGTLSSVGIPLIGIATYLNIPLPLVAGALVSGAFVGDRTSPFSSAHRLVASSTGTTVKEQYKYLMPTTILAFVSCLLFYGFSDLFGKWAKGHEIFGGTSVYEGAFHYSPLLWIPMVLLIGSILLRLPIKYGFLISSAAAIGLGTYLQDVACLDWLHMLWNGYESQEMASLHTKGLSSMIDLVLLIALAGAFNGILEKTKMIEPYMDKLLGNSRNMYTATWRIALFGLGVALLSCTQTLPIMMTGRNILPLWQQRFPKGHLSRVIADAPLVFAPLVPWNLITILCVTILGIPWEQFVIFTVFLWSLPIFTLGVSWYLGRRFVTNQSVKQSL